MSKSKSAAIDGAYRITHMDEWDQDFVDEEVEGYIRFDGTGGEFQFGYVHGFMNCEMTARDGKPAVEWSWDGNDECDAASGRGWAVLQEDSSLMGKIFFHSGDDSGFTAVKKPEVKKKSTPKRKGR